MSNTARVRVAERRGGAPRPWIRRCWPLQPRSRLVLVAFAYRARPLPRPRPLSRADSYQQGQRTQQLSPFEIDVLGPLFRNMGANLRHKVEDNFWDVAPPVAFYTALVYVVKQIRADILYHHRA